MERFDYRGHYLEGFAQVFKKEEVPTETLEKFFKELEDEFLKEVELPSEITAKDIAELGISEGTTAELLTKLELPKEPTVDFLEKLPSEFLMKVLGELLEGLNYDSWLKIPERIWKKIPEEFVSKFYACLPEGVSKRGYKKPKEYQELWGLVDVNDNIIIPLEYQHVGRCVEGFCTIAKDGKWGFFNVIDRKVAIDHKYEWANNFKNGIAPVKMNGKFAYVNTNGELVTPFKYTDACNVGEIARVSIGGKQGEIDPVTFEETWY